MSTTYADELDLSLDPGLSFGANQVWGRVRIVPVLRNAPLMDIRLQRFDTTEGPQTAALSDGTRYHAYMPAGLMVTWSDGEQRPAVETSLGTREIRRAMKRATPLRGLVRKLGKRAVRMMPQDLALEGLLALHFGGPDVAYRCWDRATQKPHALSPRWEWFVPGEAIGDLRDALRLFERHETQVGALVYVADALAGATITGHPDDYARLHSSLLQDCYARTIWRYGLLDHRAPEHLVRLDSGSVRSIPDLRAALAAERAAWAEFSAQEAAGLFGRTVRSEVVRRVGAYQLHRFITGFGGRAGDSEEHIGEVIRGQDGTVAWLKTIRLDRDQVRRVRLLDALAHAGWSLDGAAETLGMSSTALKQELALAALDFLLSPGVRSR